MRFFKIIPAFLFAIVLIGCSSKYQEPINVDTPITGASKALIKQAILASGSNEAKTLGAWKMKVINNSLIQGQLYNRGYEAVVNIPYSANGYKIQYVSASQNLKDSSGKLHRNYNRWINNLDVKIKENIFIKK